MKILEMQRSCPWLIIISGILWGRENSHLSSAANQPASTMRVAECVHSWDQLIKWGWFLTIHPHWGTASCLSTISTLDFLWGASVPVQCNVVLTLGGDLEGQVAFCGKHKKTPAYSFCLKAELGNRPICSNGGLLLCTCFLMCWLCHEDLWAGTTNQAI